MSEYNFKTLGDLITTIDKYKCRNKRYRDRDAGNIKYNADLERLLLTVDPLKKLNNLIGMDEIKTNIIDQILFYSQELNTNEMMHTCLTGPPGVGKTTLGKILAELYCSLGYLKTNKFKVVGKSDLVAGFIGQTALKTLKVLKDSLGGVLFIDEAYSLGSGTSDPDSFSKECVDTINQFLSEHTSNFILIIAGYRGELDRCFFSMNEGLRRRFPWNYDITKYTTGNLREIFTYQVNQNGWTLGITPVELNEIFQEYSVLFNNNGGDTLSLFDKAKICHSRRVFGLHKKFKKIITLTDIRLAAELLKTHKDKTNNVREVPYGMYI
jgi:SpoVK/Ycf46/Vps4 family AAA+-type ATPase